MAMQRKIYQHIASALQAMENCRKTGNAEWIAKHGDTISYIVTNHMPSGCGIDSGIKFDYNASKPNRLVFHTSFHHMDQNGYYDGWSDHTIIVTPDLASGFDIRVIGRDRNDVKNYLGEMYHHALSAELTEAEYIQACGVKAA
ncbi:MAG: hypothetical protein WA192_06335 [Candidatus Acidiferrales bacterium]